MCCALRPFLSQHVIAARSARVSWSSGSALRGDDMAKALFGHVAAAPDRRLLDEVTRLRARVEALEFEITRLRAENDRLVAAAATVEADEVLRIAEPALT